MGTYKNGEIVELIEDTMFYKKGTRAKVIHSESNGNQEKMEIRWLHEGPYPGEDVDVMPKALFKCVSSGGAAHE